MSRPLRARVFAALVVLTAAGCQDYNFSPVGHCLIQPGGKELPLSSVSTADVLFVIDDSESMEGEQDRLAAAFGEFVENLTSTNAGRASAGLLPIDFHVAVTTSSIFYNPKPAGTTPTCRNDWTDPTTGRASTGAGDLACAVGTTAVKQPRACTADSQCTGLGAGSVGAAIKCRKTCNGFKGEGFCCADGTGGTVADTFPGTSGQADVVKCGLLAAECGRFEKHYAFPDACVAGVGEDEFPLPDGQFVGSVNVSSGAANPRVLHFDKRLFTSSDKKNSQGFTRAQLEQFFRQNVRVGTCGSPQEQPLQAARRALQKALGTDPSGKRQLDTYTFDYARSLDADSVATTTRMFTVAPGVRAPLATPSWPHENSKLVLVFVGDEDDCSSPSDPASAVVVSSTDSCANDGNFPSPIGSKRYDVSSFVDYYTGLGRPVAAAFISSARSQDSENTCTGDACFAAKCCDRQCVHDLYSSQCSNPADPSTCACGYDVCGGQGTATRLVEASKQLRGKLPSGDVVVGSVCDPNFGDLLNKVAEIAKPPETLKLPTEPAESRMTILRISADGITRKICDVPLPPSQPTNYTREQAENTGADWWFTADEKPAAPYDPTGISTVAVPSKFVYINPKGRCIANPGETYTAEYLGIVPEGGCAILPEDRKDAFGNAVESNDCQQKLGGKPQDWECFVPQSLTRGTCTCRSGT